MIRIANRKSLAIRDSVSLLRKLIVQTCCIRNWHCDSNGDLSRGSNHKSRDLKVRFELPETAIWGKFSGWRAPSPANPSSSCFLGFVFFLFFLLFWKGSALFSTNVALTKTLMHGPPEVSVTSVLVMPQHHFGRKGTIPLVFGRAAQNPIETFHVLSLS